MPKPTIEFTPLESFPIQAGVPRLRLLAEDAGTGDKTIVLVHPPGQEWGGGQGSESQAIHEYWEEVLILKGRIYDKSLGQWFGAGCYCCRPPGMKHGPWIADAEMGCEEIVWIRH